MTKKLTPAQSQLVQDHLVMPQRLARKHINWKQANRASLEDLESEGYLGLIEAAISWNRLKGPFEPWAIKKIKHRFTLADYAVTYPFHMPKTAHTLVRDIRRAMLAGAETPLEVSEISGINIRKVRELWQFRFGAVVTLSPHPSDDEDAAVIDIASSQASTEDQVADGMERNMVREAVAKLPPLQRRIVELRFGFTDGRAYLAEEIALAFNITVQQVRDAENLAMLILANKLGEYDG